MSHAEETIAVHLADHAAREAMIGWGAFLMIVFVLIPFQHYAVALFLGGHLPAWLAPSIGLAFGLRNDQKLLHYMIAGKWMGYILGFGVLAWELKHHLAL